MFNQSIILSLSLSLAIGYGLVAVTHGKYSKNNLTGDKKDKDEHSKVFPPHRADKAKLESPKASTRTVDRTQPDPSQITDHKSDEFEKYRYLFEKHAAECDDPCSIHQVTKNESSLMSKDSLYGTRASTSPSSLASGKVFFAGFNSTNKEEVQNHSHENSMALGSGVVDDCKQVEKVGRKEETLGNKTTMLRKTCEQPFSCHGDKFGNLRGDDSESYFVTELKKGNGDQIEENSEQLFIEESDKWHIPHGTDINADTSLGHRKCHKSLTSDQNVDNTWDSGRDLFVRSRIQEMFVHPKLDGSDRDYGVALYKSVKEYIFPKSHLTMTRAISRHNSNKTVGNPDDNNLVNKLVKETNGNSTLATNATVDDIHSSFASVMAGFKADITPSKVDITHGTIGTQMKTEDKRASAIEKREDELESNTSVIIDETVPMKFPSSGYVEYKPSFGRVTTMINGERAPVEMAYLKDGNSIERVGLTGANIGTPVAKIEDKITRTENQNYNGTVAIVKAVSNANLTVDDANCAMGEQITGDANNTPSEKREASSRLNPEADENVGRLQVEIDQSSAKNELMNLFKQNKLTENCEALNDNSNKKKPITHIKPISDLEADDIVEFLSRLKLKRNDRKSAD